MPNPVMYIPVYDYKNPYGSSILQTQQIVDTRSTYANIPYISTDNKLVKEEDFLVQTNKPGSTYGSRYDILRNSGNANLTSILTQAGRNALSGVASGFGSGLTQQFVQPQINRIPIPLTSNIFRIQGDGAGEVGNMNQPYQTVPISRIDELSKWSITKYKDFRAFKGLTFSPSRFDGVSAFTRNRGNFDSLSSAMSIGYAAASALPGGAYTVFNLESIYGFGTHGDPNALNRDFTTGTQVRTTWKVKEKKWVTTKNPAELATEFRGDKVNVIDFSKRRLKDVYNWKAPWGDSSNRFNRFMGATDLTKDFIKFFFTGPKLYAGNVLEGADGEDDIIAFRATLDSLSDNHNPNWSAVSMIGRADPNYAYTGYTRDISLGFTVYATSRDEMKPIWRKLNALAGYTAPEYASKTIGLKGPWMRITIGDLFYQQPAIITSLSYTLVDADTTWEINIEQDPTMMQLPHKVTVQIGFNLLTDYLPEKGGRFYSLAQKYTTDGIPKQGGHNWLSDFGTNDIDNNLFYAQRGEQDTKTKYKLEEKK